MQLKDYQNEQKAITAYLKNYTPTSNIESLIASNEEYKRLLSPFFTPQSSKLAQWSNEPYIKNPYFQEKLIHKSISGNYLRSKSEAMIDAALFNKKIPYRYECQLILGDQVIFPDFTLLHPKTGKLFYWEHFGMMNNPEYAKKAENKIKLYTSNNILPSNNLILTYEFEDKPLTIYEINKTINYYF